MPRETAHARKLRELEESRLAREQEQLQYPHMLERTLERFTAGHATFSFVKGVCYVDVVGMVDYTDRLDFPILYKGTDAYDRLSNAIFFLDRYDEEMEEKERQRQAIHVALNKLTPDERKLLGL